MPALFILSLVSMITEPRMRAALIDAGLSESNARCMAARMSDRLSIGQLLRLQKLSTKGRAARTLPQFVSVVREQGDAKTIAVTTSSAALCAMGLG